MPALPTLEKRQAPNNTLEALARMVNAFVDTIVDGVRPLLANPRARSVSQPVAIKAAGSVIAHKVALGAAKFPNGWAITDIDTLATVKRTAWDATTISLTSSADCIAVLEVW